MLHIEVQNIVLEFRFLEELNIAKKFNIIVSYKLASLKYNI